MYSMTGMLDDGAGRTTGVEASADALLEIRISAKKRELERETSPTRKRVLVDELEALLGRRKTLQLAKGKA